MNVPGTTADALAATAVMLRAEQSVPRPVLLVEGDSDLRLLGRLLRARADVLPCDGKDFVLAAQRELVAGGQSWSVAFIDADFDHLDGISYEPGVVVTDHHDLETEYVRSDALLKVVDEFGSDTKLARAFGATLTTDEVAEAVRAATVAPAADIGACRYVSSNDIEMQVSYKGIKHEKLLLPQTLSVCPTRLRRVLGARGVDAESLYARSLEVRASCTETWQLVRGHDLTSLFAIGMRRLWGKGTLVSGQIESALRCQGTPSSTQLGDAYIYAPPVVG